jgi:hypothetical protein
VTHDHSAVSLITVLQVGLLGIRGSIPNRDRDASFPQRPDSLRGPPNLLSCGYQVPSLGTWRPLSSSSWRDLTTRGCTRPLPKVYMPWYLTKHRDNCKFSLRWYAHSVKKGRLPIISQYVIIVINITMEDKWNLNSHVALDLGTRSVQSARAHQRAIFSPLIY